MKVKFNVWNVNRARPVDYARGLDFKSATIVADALEERKGQPYILVRA